MAPPPPSALDTLLSTHQTPILLSAFATQVAHYQFILRADPSFSSSAPYHVSSVFRSGRFAIPRPLRAGLGWAVVFVALLTRITVAKERVREARGRGDPVLRKPVLRDSWARIPQ